jgi:hypothetical protein
MNTVLDTTLATLATYADILNKRSTNVLAGNCVSLEITKQRARLALSEALAKAPHDEVVKSIVDISISTEDNLATTRKLISLMLVNHSLMLECLALGCYEGLINCLTLQGTLFSTITNTTPSDAFAHINHEVLSNVQGQ